MLTKGLFGEELTKAVAKGVNYICPACNKPLATVTFMTVATIFVKRTCRNCHQKWQIKVIPTRIPGGMVHTGEYTKA